MESSIRSSFLRKNRRTRKGLFTVNHEWPAREDTPSPKALLNPPTFQHGGGGHLQQGNI